MEVPETIADWLNRFDEIIDRTATKPGEVKQNTTLRRCFELAFPPEGLPPKLTKREGEFSELKESHAPYYESAEETRSERGVTTFKQLTFSRKDATDIAVVLKKRGHLRKDSELVRTTLAKVQKQRAKSEYRKSAEAQLKLLEHLVTELQDIDKNYQQAKEWGDEEYMSQLEEERLRAEKSIKRIQEDAAL